MGTYWPSSNEASQVRLVACRNRRSASQSHAVVIWPEPRGHAASDVADITHSVTVTDLAVMADTIAVPRA